MFQHTVRGTVQNTVHVRYIRYTSTIQHTLHDKAHGTVVFQHTVRGTIQNTVHAVRTVQTVLTRGIVFVDCMNVCVCVAAGCARRAAGCPGISAARKDGQARRRRQLLRGLVPALHQKGGKPLFVVAVCCFIFAWCFVY